MNVLLANKLDYGGAGNACVRLHTGLIKAGENSKLLVKSKAKPLIPSSFQISPDANNYTKIDILGNKLRNIINEFIPIKKESSFITQRHPNLEMFSYPDSEYDITKTEQYKWADVVNLHWVSHLLDYKSFFKNNSKPVVWTLHDQNPFTGGEHYLETIIGIDAKGFPIKRKINAEEQKVFDKIIALKAEALSHPPNLTIVTPSQWLGKEAKESFLFKDFPVKVIPNGLDPQVFNIREKHYSRELLSIPHDKQVLLFVAETVTDFRKGFPFLQKALEKLENKDVVLLSIGGSTKHLDTSIEHIHLGGISSELLMSVIYSAADAFILPSLMDNLPNTVLESIFCGTPVIAFPVGGIVDMVDENINGILCSEISSHALYEGISKFLLHEKQFSAANIRTDAVQRFSLEKQVASYTQLYKTILK